MRRKLTAHETAVKLCVLGRQTRLTLRQKLLARRFSPLETDEAVSDVTQAGYIDEEAYAKAFVSDSYRIKRHGHIRIKKELLGRGISEEMAEEAIRSYEADELSMIAKECQRRFNPSDDFWKKYRYFLLRGFSDEDIRGCLHE